ncbi:GspH/FimT family pseudopilin [Paludifilum halophilum]|uniref:General secretion pathway GspH domain-containing protein n=1 Tax=Paludifilum halophilum TaxID=1642702 RepID=A0A235B698_9BACL|nr:GspH/FimT family pseudopilin [Paludifilum halophilum]OYD07762.1 hypothetical protein CHM34_09840 [Paludifilum halophilum]
MGIKGRNHYWASRERQGGWTLVEVSLTLALAGVMTALALPAFAQLGDRLDRELFLGALAADIRMAQREAVMREEETVVRLDRDGKSYTVLRGEQVIRRKEVPTRYRLESNYPGGRLVIRRTGQMRGGTLRLYEGKQMVGKAVIQVASGRVRVEVNP